MSTPYIGLAVGKLDAICVQTLALTLSHLAFQMYVQL